MIFISPLLALSFQTNSLLTTYFYFFNLTLYFIMSQQPMRFIPDGMNAFQRNTKRVGDCLIAFVCLVVFSPLFLICYIAVKREDGGPAIFKQERIGRFGRPFNIYKFRSMRLDAEKQGPALYKGGRDQRLTKVGRFLREHHLD